MEHLPDVTPADWETAVAWIPGSKRLTAADKHPGCRPYYLDGPVALVPGRNIPGLTIVRSSLQTVTRWRGSQDLPAYAEAARLLQTHAGLCPDEPLVLYVEHEAVDAKGGEVAIKAVRVRKGERRPR